MLHTLSMQLAKPRCSVLATVDQQGKQGSKTVDKHHHSSADHSAMTHNRQSALPDQMRRGTCCCYQVGFALSQSDCKKCSKQACACSSRPITDRCVMQYNSPGDQQQIFVHATLSSLTGGDKSNATCQRRHLPQLRFLYDHAGW